MPSTAHRSSTAPARRLVILPCTVVTAAFTAAVVSITGILPGVSSLTPTAIAQFNTTNPVFVDDSPTAASAIRRVAEFIAQDNIPEASRVLQRLLDEQPDRLIPVTAIESGLGAADAEWFVSVRHAALRALEGEPALLDWYRRSEGPLAEAMLGEGRIDELERSRPLTTAGFIAAVRIAQRHFESARFDAARIVLQSLVNHPDRRPPTQLATQQPPAELAEARRIADHLVDQLPRYITNPDRDDVFDLARTWRDETRRQALDRAAIQPADIPQQARLTPHDPISGGLSTDLAGLINKPLATADLPEPATPDDAVAATMVGQNLRGVAETAINLWGMPTAHGENLYINTGRGVAAWNQLTLEPLWTYIPRGATRLDFDAARTRIRRTYPSVGTSIEDPLSIAAGDGVVAAVTGLAMAFSREGDPRLHAIDAATGKPLWTAVPRTFGEDLERGEFRGAPAISEGVLIAPVRRFLPERRQQIEHLLGFNARTGELLWKRTVASSGTLPHRMDGGVATGVVIDRGIAYFASRQGVVTAIDVFTGRPRWARRLDAVPGNTAANPEPTWSPNTPIVANDRLLVLSSDRRTLLTLDTRTGQERHRLSTGAVLNPTPRYLVRSGEHIALVNDRQIVVLPIAEPERAQAQATRMFPEPGIRGRVVSAGDRLFVPLGTGFVVVDPLSPADGSSSIVQLDRPGSLLPLGDRITVVDDQSAHQYVLWDRAELVLRERIDNAGDDPTPAVTYAGLAHRAGATQRVIEASNLALDAIARDADQRRAADQRRRLFDTLDEIIDVRQTARFIAEAGSTRRPADDTTDRALLDLLDRSANEPAQRVGYILAAARSAQLDDRVTDAVDLYQRILDDTTLAPTERRGDVLSVRADLYVHRRLADLIAAHGREPYSHINQRAAEELAALPQEPLPASVESLARRFPHADATPTIYLRLADAYARAGNTYAQVNALEAGFRSASQLDSTDMHTIATIVASLLTALDSAGQTRAAADIYRNATDRFGSQALLSADTDGAIATIAARLDDRLGTLYRWPRIGNLQADGVSLLDGWTLLTPLLEPAEPRRQPALALRSISSQGAISVALAVPADNNENAVNITWEHSTTSDDAWLVSMDETAAIFAYADQSGLSLERVRIADGQSLWSTPPTRELFTEHTGDHARVLRNAAALTERIPTPLDGRVRRDAIVIAADERTTVLADRSGRLAAINTATGETMWSIVTTVDRLYDVAVQAGTIVIAGDEEGPGTTDTASLRAVVVVIDAASGDIRSRLPQPDGQIRWIRMDAAGTLYLATERSVSAFDLRLGMRRWHSADRRLQATRDAWIFGQRAMILGGLLDRTITLIDTTTGAVIASPLDDPRQRLAGTRPIRIFQADNTHAAISTFQGVYTYALETGRLIGADQLGGFDNLVAPVPAQGALVTIDAVEVDTTADGIDVFTLYRLASPAASLEQAQPLAFGTRPRRIAILDGLVAVQAGGSTIIVRAPINE